MLDGINPHLLLLVRSILGIGRAVAFRGVAVAADDTANLFPELLAEHDMLAHVVVRCVVVLKDAAFLSDGLGGLGVVPRDHADLNPSVLALLHRILDRLSERVLDAHYPKEGESACLNLVDIVLILSLPVFAAIEFLVGEGECPEHIRGHAFNGDLHVGADGLGDVDDGVIIPVVDLVASR